MSKNNNIEDFFNASMEQFNDVPDDSVWSGINENLEQKPPFYKTGVFWLASLLGILLLIGSINYVGSTQEKINGLLNDNKKLELQNEEMGHQLIECSYRSLEAERILEEYTQLEKSEKEEKKSAIIPPIKKETQKDYDKLEKEYIQFKENYTAPKLEEIPNVVPQVIETTTDSNLYLDGDIIIQEKTKTEVKIYSYDKDKNREEIKIEVEGVKPDFRPEFFEKVKDKTDKVKDFFKRKKKKKEE